MSESKKTKSFTAYQLLLAGRLERETKDPNSVLFGCDLVNLGGGEVVLGLKEGIDIAAASELLEEIQAFCGRHARGTERRRLARADTIAEDLCGGASGLDAMRRDLAKLLGGEVT